LLRRRCGRVSPGEAPCLIQRSRWSSNSVSGHTNAQIADQLYLSVRTVETHRSHIQSKLRLTTRAQLVEHALEHGLIKPRRA